MYRWMVRVSAFLFLLVAGISLFRIAGGMQTKVPFDCTATFALDVSQATVPKDELARGLAAVGERTGATICKSAADPRASRTTRDVILFSGPAAGAMGPLVEQGGILWLSDGLSGSLLSADGLSERSLNGTYGLKEAPGVRADLEEWAGSNGVRLTWDTEMPRPSSSAMVAALAPSTFGPLIASAALLVIAALACLLQQRVETMRVLVVSGKPYGGVRAEACGLTARLLLEGAGAGLLCLLPYLLVRGGGVAQGALLAEFVLVPAGILLLALLLLAVACTLLSVPPFKRLGARSPSQFLKLLGVGLSGLGLALCVVIAISAQHVMAAQAGTREQLRVFERIPEAARVSVFYTGQESMLADPRFPDLIERAEDAGDLMLSLDVGSSMQLEDGELGEFDRFAIVNERYMQMVEGDAASGASPALEPVPAEEVPPLASSYLPIWAPNVDAGTYRFCRYRGPGLPVLGSNVGAGGGAAIAHNPLVLVIDGSLGAWDASGFTVPLLINGNIFFSDAHAAEAAAEGAGVMPLVSSIDTITDQTLVTLQDMELQFAIMMMSLSMAGAIIVAMGLEQAVAWATLKRGSVFAHRSAGDPLARIAARGLAARILPAAAGIALAVAYELMKYQTGSWMTVGISLGALAVFISSQMAFRCWAARRVFSDTVSRR